MPMPDWRNLFGDRATPQAADFATQIGAATRNDAEKFSRSREIWARKSVVAGRRGSFYDGSELFLEVAIVLCSISLLSGSAAYWRASFLFSALGVAGILWGLLLVH